MVKVIVYIIILVFIHTNLNSEILPHIKIISEEAVKGGKTDIMAKFYSMPTTQSTHSIDISKPEGISSFWNLCSKSDKQSVQQGNNKQKINLNKFALKLLKLKGIDLTNTNIDNFEGGDFHSLTQNKQFVVLNSNQTKLNKKDLLKQNMFANVLNNQNQTPNQVADLELRVFPQNGISMNSGQTRLIRSSMVCSTSKKQNFCSVMDKEGLKPAEDYEFVKLLSSSLSESKMFMSFPEAKHKKRIKKRLMVPVYIGKKKSNKIENFDEEYLVNNYERKDEAMDMSTLIHKIKTMEKKLNYLESKTKKHMLPETVTTGSNKTEIVNHPLTNSRPMKLNVKKSHENSVNINTKEKNNKNLTLIQFYPNQAKKETKKKGKERIEEILTDPDILIKNHNLVIPSIITEENLFKANPSAGCDTVLKLFDALSEQSKHSDQPNGHPSLSTEEVIRNSTNYCDSMEIKRGTNNFSFITNIGEGNETSVHDTSKDTIKINNVIPNSPETSKTDRSIINSGDFSGESYNNFQNIFSLPINLSNLKICNQKPSGDEGKQISLDLAKKEVTECPNIGDGQTGNSAGLKTILTKNEDQVGNETLIHKLQTNELQINNEDRNVKFENNTVRDTLMDQGDNFERQEVSERTLNKPEVGLEKIVSTQELQNSSPPFTKNHDEVNSVYPTTNNMHKINLNIFSEQCKIPGMPGQQKLLKKTTIACPVNSPDKKISITILIENNSKDGKSILMDSCVNEKSPYFDTKNSSSLVNLKNENFILEKEQIIHEKNICSNEAQECYVIDNFFQKCLPLFNLSAQNNIIANTVDKKQETKQNDCGDFFGLSSKVTYLTKGQRQGIDKKELGIGSKKIDKEFPDLKNGLENVHALKKLSNYAQESNKGSQFSLKAKNRYTLHRSGRYNPKNTLNSSQSFAKKVQSKTKIVELDSFYKRASVAKNITNDNRPLNNTNYCSSLPMIKNDTKDDQRSHKHRAKGNYCQGCRKISEYILNEKKNISDKNERPCRFRVTLNEGSLARQVENNSSVLKSTGNLSQELKREFKNVGNNCYIRIINKSPPLDTYTLDNEGSLLEMNKFVDNDVKYSSVNKLVYRTIVSSDKKDFNKIGISMQEYTSNSCDTSPIESNISEYEQENMKLKNCDTEENTLNSVLFSSQNTELDSKVQSYCHLESMSTKKIKPQELSIHDSKCLLNYLDNQVTNKAETNDNDSLKSDARCVCDENVRKYTPRNRLNKNNNDNLQSIEEEPESACNTKEDISCHCCVYGCLTVPDDWNEEPEE